MGMGFFYFSAPTLLFDTQLHAKIFLFLTRQTRRISITISSNSFNSRAGVWSWPHSFLVFRLNSFLQAWYGKIGGGTLGERICRKWRNVQQWNIGVHGDIKDLGLKPIHFQTIFSHLDSAVYSMTFWFDLNVYEQCPTTVCNHFSIGS